MQINYTGAAFETLIDIVNFVESVNTLGAGVRWLNKFESFLERALTEPTLVKICNNKTFADLDLRCVNFNDWVIAFTTSDGEVIIEAILHSSRLVD